MENKYKAVPFWSWNDDLQEEELVNQINWMHDNGIGGFFMHARGGLTTPYLGEKWFSCIEACLKRAKDLDMEAYAYDENGWPSGFAGMKLLEDSNNCDTFLRYSIGEYDPNSFVSYDISTDKLIRTTKGKNCLNVFKFVSNSTVDILNKDVVRKFINLTHEEYKKHDKYGNLKGFFTDEPQYYRWDHPYTNMLPKYFKEHYGEDILDRLGLMFVEKEGYRDFRFKYWNAMQDLMLTSFAKQIYYWCDENGYKLTGHYVEESSLGFQMMCSGGMMPFYAYEHIPGVDWLGRVPSNPLTPKQVGSVAQQLGKEQVLTECFACVGWDTTPIELKRIAEALYVNGVNLMCHHLLPYSEHGQRKRDYPEHYSKVNPWVNKYFDVFNDYFSSLGKTLSTSKEIVNVAVFHPIRSCYFNYKRELESTGFGVRDLDNNLLKLMDELKERQINYQFVDEVLLKEHGSVNGSNLKMGLCEYKYLIFPLIYTMGKETNELLKKYIASGGKAMFYSDKPTYLEGEEYNYDYLNSNISWEDIKNDQEFKPENNSNIMFTYRIDKNGNKFVFAVNASEPTDWVIKNEILTDGVNNYQEVIHFDKDESKILQFTNKKPTNINNLESFYLKKEFDIVGNPTNYLLLDFIRYSKDGINYSEPLHYMGIFNQMLQEKYCGDLFLKYTFESKYIPSICNALIEDTRTKKVSINGIEIEKTGTVLEKDLWKFDLAKYIKIGTNEIVVQIQYKQQDIVYFALSGCATESLKNCLAYDTTIEAIYLQGDFGVYGKFEDSKNNRDVVIGSNFYLDKQKKHITSLIRDGFPFFRGEISLSQTINVTSTNKCLIIPERFQSIDVSLNDKKVGTMLFTNKIDLSKDLKNGNNEIVLDLIVSNRNLLGTHHELQEESYWVGPHSFEKLGTWTNGKSSILRETYSFIKTII